MPKYIEDTPENRAKYQGKFKVDFYNPLTQESFNLIQEETPTNFKQAIPTDSQLVRQSQASNVQNPTRPPSVPRGPLAWLGQFAKPAAVIAGGSQGAALGTSLGGPVGGAIGGLAGAYLGGRSASALQQMEPETFGEAPQDPNVADFYGALLDRTISGIPGVLRAGRRLGTQVTLESAAPAAKEAFTQTATKPLRAEFHGSPAFEKGLPMIKNAENLGLLGLRKTPNETQLKGIFNNRQKTKELIDEIKQASDGVDNPTFYKGPYLDYLFTPNPKTGLVDTKEVLNKFTHVDSPAREVFSPGEFEKIRKVLTGMTKVNPSAGHHLIGIGTASTASGAGITFALGSGNFSNYALGAGIGLVSGAALKLTGTQLAHIAAKRPELAQRAVKVLAGTDEAKFISRALLPALRGMEVKLLIPGYGETEAIVNKDGKILPKELYDQKTPEFQGPMKPPLSPM